MTASDPCFLSIAEAASLIAAKRLSPVELTRAYLDRIEALNGNLHAYVRVLNNEALTAALQVALGLRRSQVQLIAGLTSRDKRFLIRGLTRAALEAKLAALLVY